ncbi:MAG: CDP-glycerol glycerophosphotransferase family protein [Mycoplasmatales bacterium]
MKESRNLFSSLKSKVRQLISNSNEKSFFETEDIFVVTQNQVLIIEQKENPITKLKYNLHSIPMNQFKNKNYRTKIEYEQRILQKNSLCLFYDRIDCAADNAETLYIYMQNLGFDNCFFIIKKECSDYERLTNLGLKLIDYGSDEFKEKYVNADYIFSSSADNEIINYKGLRFQKNKAKFTTKFIFLQHGVITDDLADWINQKRFDLMVISTHEELKFVENDYLQKRWQFVTSGLPRFDNYQLSRTSQSSKILCAPTWRNFQSDISKQWNSVFDKLVELELDFVIKTHPLLDVSLFHYPEKHSNAEYKQLIQECDLLLTDYSSIFMDFVYLNKPIIFYPFDQEVFFQNHTYSQKMDYKNNSYGKSFTKVEELAEVIKQSKEMNKIDRNRVFLNTEKHSEKLVELLMNTSL